LRDPELAVRVQAGAALWRVGRRLVPALPALVEGLRSGDEIIGWTAADCLGDMGAEAADAVPGLLEALGTKQRPLINLDLVACDCMARTEIYVSADLRCTGVEVRAGDDPARELVVTQPAELGLSTKLVADFRLWQRWFDAVSDLCGLEDRFEYLGDKFDEVGRELAERWCRKLGPGRSLVVQE
jgi:hypothetical protein